MSRHTMGSLLIAGCALSWGFIAILVRELDLPAMAIVFYRVALAAAAVAAVSLLIGRRDLLRPPGRPVLALGLLLALHWTVFFAAIKETSVASALLVTYAAPVFMAMLAPAMLRERVPATSIGALVASVLGIALITLAGGGDEGAVRAVGVGLAVVAAVTYALLILFLKKYGSHVEPVTVVLYESVVAALVLSPAALAGGYSIDAADVGYLLLLGVALTGVASIVYVSALRWVAATTAGILAYMEPVSSAILAALLLGEELTGGVVAGGAAIVVAGAAVMVRAPAPVAAPAGVPSSPAPREEEHDASSAAT